MGPNKWDVVKAATRGHDVRGTMFDIPPNCAPGQSLRFKEFKLEAIEPYVYDIYIGARGVSPNHDQVPLYFAKHVYAKFVLDMRPNYTSTAS